jgi:hypothetical protein
MTDRDDEEALRARVERLPREMPTERDLWPAIRARVLRASPSRRRERWLRIGGSAGALAAAAALVLALRGRSPLPTAGTSADAARAGPVVGAFAGESDYVGAERALDAELASRRPELPSGATAVIDRNLRIVDDAIASTRSALLENPGDPELRAELDRDWQDKLDLLRDAVELPGGM